MSSAASQRRLAAILVAAALLLGVGFLLGKAASQGSSSAATSSERPAPDRTDDSTLPRIAVSALPAQALKTLELIAAGGPYPYPRDGVVFSNREGLLPTKARGYYREYTVATPGASSRGAKRIVTGESGERYYTADHYASFSQIEGADAAPR